MTPPTTTPSTAPTDVYYPDSDGQPMGETEIHVLAILKLYEALRRHFRGRSEVFVAADMFLYYQEGDPRKVKAPDVMVVFGVTGTHYRRSFKTWVEKAVPAVVFEVSSDETIKEDLQGKRDLYARLGVSEYYLFDPLGDCLDPQLQGLRLVGTHYESMPADPDGGLTSPTLGLRLHAEEDQIRLCDPDTSQPILTFDELPEVLEEKSQALEEKSQALEEKSQALEEKSQALVEKSQALEEKSQALEEKSQALEKKSQALVEKSQALEAERRRAEVLASEVERLRKLLEQRGGNGGR